MTSGNEQKLKHRMIHLNIRKCFFTVWMTDYWNLWLNLEKLWNLPLEILKSNLCVLGHLFYEAMLSRGRGWVGQDDLLPTSAFL